VLRWGAASLSWRGASLQVRMIVSDDSGAAEAKGNLSELIASTRMNAQVDVIVDDRWPIEIIGEASRPADLTLIGRRSPMGIRNALPIICARCSTPPPSFRPSHTCSLRRTWSSAHFSGDLGQKTERTVRSEYRLLHQKTLEVVQ
jgi:hypothetical protein